MQKCVVFFVLGEFILHLIFLAHLTQSIMSGIAITWCLSSLSSFLNFYILIFFSEATRIENVVCQFFISEMLML
jgi:hypothetical protein